MSLSYRARERVMIVLVIFIVFLLLGPGIHYVLNIDLVLANPARYDPTDPYGSIRDIIMAKPHYNESQIALLIHDEVNRIRTERGISPLDWDAGLAGSARAHSLLLQESHAGPAKNLFHSKHPEENLIYDSVIDRDFYDGYLFARYENPKEIARDLVDGWMHSTFHAVNVLDPRMTKEGIGISIEAYTIYATEQFS